MMKSLIEKWAPVLDIANAPKITDAHKRFVTAQLLENEVRAMHEEAMAHGGIIHTMLNEDVPVAPSAYADGGVNLNPKVGPGQGVGAPLAPGFQMDLPNTLANHGGVQFDQNGQVIPGTGGGIAAGYAGGASPMAGYDKVLINLVRRAMPQLIAFDVCGVQPMTSPSSMIFAMKSRYVNQNGPEAFYQEADSGFSGDGFGATRKLNNPEDQYGFNGKYPEGFPKAGEDIATHSDWTGSEEDIAKVGHGMSTFEAERLGAMAGVHGYQGNRWGEMSFSIEKTVVAAKSRALKAEYTLELAQDLKAVHGLDAETELSNILATEILAELNREVIRTIYATAKVGCQSGTAQAGVFDLDIDADGRWSAEKYKGLMYRIEREANAIAHETRRGRGNFIICSSDVASALQQAGMIDYAPAIQNNLQVDEATQTFAGILNGKYKVFIDPYTANPTEEQFVIVGYKGATPYDAGLFYCPYVPLQLIRAQDPYTMQPRIGFKTRYGLVANPFVQLDSGEQDVNGMIPLSKMVGKNYYFRRFSVRGL